MINESREKVAASAVHIDRWRARLGHAKLVGRENDTAEQAMIQIRKLVIASVARFA
jgi:hypothetical protein